MDLRGEVAGKVGGGGKGEEVEGKGDDWGRE